MTAVWGNTTAKGGNSIRAMNFADFCLIRIQLGRFCAHDKTKLVNTETTSYFFFLMIFKNKQLNHLNPCAAHPSVLK